ncbi:MAG: hypothetical protein GYA51_01695 [Candidatus Methanofastidiosa archaeon]|nr:hypothetical protein [Candidatus Methanofastidiosa archaeon]
MERTYNVIRKFNCSILLLLIINLNLSAQDEIISEDVVAVDSVKKEMLYKRALRWIVLDHNSSKNELRLQDSINRELNSVFKYNYGISVKGKPMADYCSASDRMIFVSAEVTINIQVFCRDGRYKYKILVNGIETKRLGSNYAKTEETKKVINDEIIKRTLLDIDLLKTSLRDNLSKPLEIEKEW